MDKDRVVGSAKVVKGKIKAAVGKAVGDSKLETEGKADKIEGPGAILSMPMLAITKIICDRVRPLAAFGHFLEG